MAEIAAIPWNGFRVVSTFSGCGGSCLGYRMAGYHVVWANEFVPIAQASYRANMPGGCFLDGRDIHQIRAEDILATIGLQVGEVDVLDGSPPCQAFSTAGKRAKGWGHMKRYEHGARQCNETLFTEYIRLLRGLQPKVFVAENVSGLVKGVAKGYFKAILRDLKASGYRVEARLLDAQWLGVPQMRQRIIFQGVREDIGRAPTWPRPLPYRYSVREALPWIVATGGIRHTGFGQHQMVSAYEPSGTIMAVGGHGMNTSQFGVEARLFDEEASGFNSTGLGQHRMIDMTENVMPTIQAHRPVSMRIEAETDISRYAIGKEWDRLTPGGQSQRYFQLVKPDAAFPCPTITQSAGNTSTASVCHPTEKRKFSIAELKRICAFPDDFVLIGSYAQQWARLGNAVPPVMMQHIAMHIRMMLDAAQSCATAG